MSYMNECMYENERNQVPYRISYHRLLVAFIQPHSFMHTDWAKRLYFLYKKKVTRFWIGRAAHFTFIVWCVDDGNVFP